MMFDPDPYIKGDFKVVAKGAIGLLHKETLQMRRNEFLMATANPIDSQITGIEGRAYMLRESARGLQMDTSKIVPDQNTFEEQKIQARAQIMAQEMVQQLLAQMQQQQGGGQPPMLQAPQEPMPQPMEQPPMQMADGGQVDGQVETMADQVVRSLAMNGSL
jgi:hypothetical protein